MDARKECTGPFERKVGKCARRPCLSTLAPVVLMAGEVMRRMAEDGSPPRPARSLVQAAVIGDPGFRSGGAYPSLNEMAVAVRSSFLEATKQSVVGHCEAQSESTDLNSECTNPYNLHRHLESGCFTGLSGRRDVSDAEWEQFCEIVKREGQRQAERFCMSLKQP